MLYTRYATGYRLHLLYVLCVHQVSIFILDAYRYVPNVAVSPEIMGGSVEQTR